MRRILSFITASMVLLAACQSTPTPEPTPTEEPVPTATPIPKGQIFKIYSSLPLSGERADEARGIVNAINLAIEKQTDPGGTLCDGILKITHESLDDALSDTGVWDTFREQDNAYKANADADAMAYIGPLDSGAARVAVPILNQASIVVVSPGTDYVGLTKPYEPSDPMVYYITGKRSFARFGAPMDTLAAAAANWAKTLGATKVFIVDDGEQYGLGASDAFNITAKEAGLEVAGREMIEPKARNLADIVGQVKGAKPGLVFFSGDNAVNGGQLLQALRKEGVDAKFMGTPIIQTKPFVTAAGAAGEGTYAVGSGIVLDKLTAKGQQFAQDYKAKFGAAPTSAAVFGYDAATAVLGAARKVCLKDRVALMDATVATQNLEGALGQWSFDANGDVNPQFMMGYMLKAGAWQPVSSITLP